MKKTKRVAALLLVLMMALALAACSNNTAENSENSADKTADQAGTQDAVSSDPVESEEPGDNTESSAPHPGMDRDTVEARIGVYEGTYKSPDGTYTTQNYALTYTNEFVGITFNSNNEWLMTDDKRSFAGLNTEGDFEPIHVFPAFSAAAVDGSAHILIDIETPAYRELDADISAKDYVAYMRSILRDGLTASEPHEVMVAGEAYEAITITKQEDAGTPTEMSMCRRIDDVIVIIHISISEGVSFEDVLSHIS